MNKDELIKRWKAEEAIAHIHGWDFSHIADQIEEEPLPWDYREEVLRRLKPEDRLLDIDTGGGEMLLSLGHPYGLTAATEDYPPNVELCRQTLLPLGIDFRPANGEGTMPFEDGYFDMVINRHGDFNPAEVYRILKPGGLFITQQVGADNDRELVTLLCGPLELPYPEQYLSIAKRRFESAGFEILDGREYFRAFRFFDVGALVWFARVIPWEFPNFSVDSCLDRLLNAQALLERDGVISARAHRYFLVAQKPQA